MYKKITTSLKYKIETAKAYEKVINAFYKIKTNLPLPFAFVVRCGEYKNRVIFSMKQIEYAINYVKDKLMKDYVGARRSKFLIGSASKQLQKILINCNLWYWQQLEMTISNNIFKYRISLLFEICIRLKRADRYNIKLPKNKTFEQVYEKGLRELQVQLTTYWDHIIATMIYSKRSDLLDSWSCNVVARLMHLKPMSSNNYCYEMSLIVGYKDHSIYLNNKFKLLQPYVIAYVPCNSMDINQHKKWLKIISTMY
ncbi:hypothetical protein RFI_28771 [Reticulomyxa filosa]|uniref:Uncharacterized protein n=1 Tax=Reticulomyxa filosa TaxID=46433 RepID=X6M4N9_RETFI|nr:hypothetical protein RFI_28771 [Reticulomyxa filosa]|eukprot:ETO08616.1 hypothetical protein RFI_28771 [Reticulomyxa filosa]